MKRIEIKSIRDENILLLHNMLAIKLFQTVNTLKKNVLCFTTSLPSMNMLNFKSIVHFAKLLVKNCQY